MDWTKILLTTILGTILFFLVVQTRIGLMLETSAFATVLFILLIASEQKK